MPIPKTKTNRYTHLPPYSPDFNLIEQVFSKLKTLLRKHAERTVESLGNRVGVLIDAFSPNECRNYLRHCGYSLQSKYPPAEPGVYLVESMRLL